MPSLRDIRRNIKSVKSTQQITYAMKMVAVARIRKAQALILAARPFALKMEEMIRDLRGELNEEDFQNSPVYNLFSQKKQPDSAESTRKTAPRTTRDCFAVPRSGADSFGLIVVSSDKGLCGAFNTNILRAALDWLKTRQDKKIYAAVVGKKARDFIRRLKGIDLELAYESVGIFPRAGYVHADMLGNAVLDIYANKRVESVTVIYNEFKSLMSQQIVAKEFIPLEKGLLEKSGFPAGGMVKPYKDFLFEPGKRKLLKALLPRYIKAQLYRMLLESQSAELAARMNAMESASKNAADLIESLTLRLNRMRQSMITKELAELVGGAEALNG